jgi:hypothetical protein
MAKRKYSNVPATLDGIRFASKLEAKRYGELKLLERAKQIRLLEVHPRYPLSCNGIHICDYVADFAYVVITGGYCVVEDTKGFATPEYKLKVKLFRANYPEIEFREVRK